MVAPRIIDQIVGGWYRITAGEDDEGGDAESSSGLVEYCSLSDRIVTPDSAKGFGISSEDILIGDCGRVGVHRGREPRR